MIRYDLPASEYHAHPALSSSVVKKLTQTTPAHVRAWLDSEQKESPAMLRGDVTHAAILEPHALEARYFPAEWGPRNTKAGKEAYRAAQEAAEAEGKALVPQSDFDAARAMRDAVHAHPEARMVLAKGRAEVSVFVTDEEFGTDLRSREDWKPTDFDVIADLKTARDASPWGFSRDAFKLGYPISAYHYVRTRRIETGESCDFMWIAVEPEPPYAVACYYADDDVMTWAEDRWRKAVRAYCAAKESGQWSGYDTESTALAMPFWARRELDEIDLGLEL